MDGAVEPRGMDTTGTGMFGAQSAFSTQGSRDISSQKMMYNHGARGSYNSKEEVGWLTKQQTCTTQLISHNLAVIFVHMSNPDRHTALKRNERPLGCHHPVPALMFLVAPVVDTSDATAPGNVDHVGYPYRCSIWRRS